MDPRGFRLSVSVDTEPSFPRAQIGGACPLGKGKHSRLEAAMKSVKPLRPAPRHPFTSTRPHHGAIRGGPGPITRSWAGAYLSAMAMTWDALLVAALAQELNTLLRDARLKGHRFRWEERELSLFFREGTLRWHLHPRRGWVTFTSGEAVPEDARPLSAQVLGVTAPPDERLLEIRLLKRRGKGRIVRLVVELMSNQWNALLLEGEEGRIRHLLWTRRLEERTLAIGQTYTAPAPSTRRGIHPPLTAKEWELLLGGLSPEEARRTLLEEVAFTSPINVAYLLKSGEASGEARVVGPGDGWTGGSGEAVKGPGGPEKGGAPGEPRSVENSGAEGTEPAPGPGRPRPEPELVGKLPKAGGTQGFDRWEALRSPTSRSPSILEIGLDKQPYPFVLKTFRYTLFSNLITAIEAVAREGEGAIDPADEVLERMERALHRARGRARGIRKEMAQAADPEEPRSQANLLLARLGEVPRGAASVTLEGFGGEGVRIPLDPALSASENAQALYQEAARRERARSRLPPLLDEAERAVLELEHIQEGLSEGSLDPREASARIPGLKPVVGPRKRQEVRIPFRRFFSSGGLEIRVGRSSRENDTLTFRHSHPEDIWLHARDRAGAHVILRWNREDNPPQRDLAEAAILASLHSGARTSGTVPVDWTRRKYVRKPRKGSPGTVILERTQTLFVEPDPDLPGRLRQEEKGKEEEKEDKR